MEMKEILPVLIQYYRQGWSKISAGDVLASAENKTKDITGGLPQN